MSSTTHDFVTVEMRGLKAALVARARDERVSVSAVVRRAVERELGVIENSHEPGGAERSRSDQTRFTKLSLRLTCDEIKLLDAGARRAGASRAAYVAGLLSDQPTIPDSAPNRPEQLSALTASCAELSTLSRNVHHLTALLRQGDIPAAREYRRLFDTLGSDVRLHLDVAASVLAELRPARGHRRLRPPLV